MEKKEFMTKFLNIPVSINNLYGDPFLQRKNTFQKLKELEESGHTGIVSIITKSEISEDDAKMLKTFQLRLIVLVSISMLPYEIERTKGNRFMTLKRCKEHGIPCLAYIRPFIPGLNTDAETLEMMFKNIAETGVKTCVISGLRGNDAILADSGIDIDSLENWSQRVKIVPKEVRQVVDRLKVQYGITMFERTSCGVSYVLGLERSYNPYWFSAQLAKCKSCPLKKSCYDKQKDFTVTDEDVEFARILGYDAKHVNVGEYPMCKTDPAKRTECVSCCTGCFILKRDSLEIKRTERYTLGDVSLLRLLLQKHVFCKNTIDFGNCDVARPQNQNLAEYNLYLLNSWWSLSRNTSHCYGCTYCIVPTYQNQNLEYGMIPAKAGELIWEKWEKGGKENE